MIYENLRIYFLIFLVGFYYHPVWSQDPDLSPYQVVFSEIMADPTPQKGLPPFEYLELYNRGMSPVNLRNCRLMIGTHAVILPEFIMEPDEYVVLCDSVTQNLFLIKNLVFISLPALANEGQTIVLKSAANQIIHCVEYSDKWYSNKPEGGVSLEIIDPDNPCAKGENWLQSIHEQGGTPGMKNSVAAENPDDTAPSLLRASMSNDSSVMLYFNESMNPSTIESTSSYSVNHGLLHPLSVVPVQPDFQRIILNYSRHFEEGATYVISTLNDAADCAGNNLSGRTSVEFAIPSVPEAFGMVFNEVLFHAAEIACEFIEFYNRSSKVLDMSLIELGMADLNDHGIIRKINFSRVPFLVFPGEYVVITKNKSELLKYKNAVPEELIMEISTLFSLPDNEGILVITDTSDAVIDEFYYSSDYHTSLLTSDAGVSLERKNPDEPSNDPQNWCTASSLAGFSTPGIRNSQINTEKSSVAMIMSLEYFTPDDDGMDDILEIMVQSSESGAIGSLSIYNTYGVLINKLVSGALFGTETLITWNGRDQNNHPVNIGPYIFYLELVTQSGKIEIIKKVVSVIRRNN